MLWCFPFVPSPGRCVRVCVYIHHLSSYQWSDNDNKSHVTFARLPRATTVMFLSSGTRLRKAPVNDVRLIAISSPMPICPRRMYMIKQQKERFPSFHLCRYLFLANIWLSLIQSMFTDNEPHFRSTAKLQNACSVDIPPLVCASN